MEKPKRTKRIFVIAVLVCVAFLFAVYLRGPLERTIGRPSGPPTFDGDSSDLKRTQVVATLDAPIEKGKNVIWCSSYQAAWKKLQGLAKGPVRFAESVSIANALNNAPSPRSDVPEGCLYATAGWEDKGILQQIDNDLKQQFPGKPAPTFPGIAHRSFVAYSCLEVNAKFGLPYLQNQKPLTFRDSAGKGAGVSSFGIPPKDGSASSELCRQPQIVTIRPADLSRMRRGVMDPLEFAVDLDCDSEPTQVIAAVIEPKPTLEEAVAYVETRMTGPGKTVKHRVGLSENDALLVPDIYCLISHHFKELERKHFQNASLKRQSLGVAQEDISFRLDRSGTQVKAESKNYASCAPTYYFFDKPFLVYMKKRGAAKPYFVMWVDNAELLRKMNSDVSVPIANRVASPAGSD